MKILLLADPSNPHTIKWVNSLNQEGFDIILIGLSKYNKNDYADTVKILSLKTPSIIKSKHSGNFLKIIYLAIIPQLKKTIRKFDPDVLHAHYASSYGLIGALTNFHPFILSVWGIDINVYPKVSIIYSYLVKYVLRKADLILATSEHLKKETLKYSNKNVEVVPFGIDLNIFCPNNVISIFNKNDIVVGTVKRLEDKYGIDKLIEAFSQIKVRNPELPLKLLLVGEGSIRPKLVELVNKLKIAGITTFAGEISHDKVTDYHNMIDVSVFLSKTESFGVSVLEASACENPVVVHNVGGLPEVVDHEITGLIVPSNNIEASVLAIEKLVLSKPLREAMGKAGRQKVIKEFDWKKSVQKMIKIYKESV